MLDRLKRIYAAEGICIGIFSLVNKIYCAALSLFFARLLSAPGLKINSWPNFHGVNFLPLGRDVFVNGSCWIECFCFYGGDSYAPRLVIGDNVSFSERVHISCANDIWIGSGVLFGSNVYVSDNSHGVYAGAIQSSPLIPPAQRPLSLMGEVRIGNNVWIGDNCLIMAPASIGDGAIIGGNSLVKTSVPSGEMWAGVPAKCIKYFDKATQQWIPKK